MSDSRKSRVNESKRCGIVELVNESFRFVCRKSREARSKDRALCLPGEKHEVSSAVILQGERVEALSG